MKTTVALLLCFLLGACGHSGNLPPKSSSMETNGYYPPLKGGLDLCNRQPEIEQCK